MFVGEGNGVLKLMKVSESEYLDHVQRRCVLSAWQTDHDILGRRISNQFMCEADDKERLARKTR